MAFEAPTTGASNLGVMGFKTVSIIVGKTMSSAICLYGKEKMTILSTYELDHGLGTVNTVTDA